MGHAGRTPLGQSKGNESLPPSPTRPELWRERFDGSYVFPECRFLTRNLYRTIVTADVEERVDGWLLVTVSILQQVAEVKHLINPNQAMTKFILLPTDLFFSLGL